MQIAMLGPFEVRTDDGVVADVPGARLRALLIALALEPGRTVPQARLVDWIWGGQPPADTANALQQLVSRLRKVLPDGWVEGQAGGYRLTVAPDAVDAVRFERLVDQARDDDPRRVRLLREALGLWRGAAMQDVGLHDNEAFDAAVARLERLRLAAMEDRFDAETGLGHGAELVEELTDLVAVHPLRERLVAALMRALVSAGRDTEALLVYERTREALADALGVDPSPELSALHTAVLRGEVGRRDETRATNLPAELTSFVGKEADVDAVRELIGAHRLTTLIGPGGSGKTRLATETARTLLGDVPDGVWLVELAAIGAGDDVASAALAGLGLRDALLGEASNLEPADRFVAAVRDRETLLILDNCEHVIESAAAFAHRALGECRRLRILATSREPLGITGEALWPVEPLAVPAEDAAPADIESAPAVRLLRDRAGAVRQDLGADTHTLSTMVRICRALDGMPLAIELAAARLRTMTVDQLATRLDHRFRLLTGGSRTALPRHRTLRAMVDWSWELLSEAERTVLCRLSVFSGGASLEAAEHVCAGASVEPDDVLELLTALAEKSLLVAGGDGAPRYRMLGTIKEYAADRLAEAGETALARQAHLAYFTELAETAEPHLRRAEQLPWLATLRADHDNLSAALRGAVAAGDAQAAMRLAAATGWYWWLGGRRSEGLEHLVAAASVPGDATDDVRALTYGMVVLFVTSGRSDEHAGAEWIRKAYRFSRQSGSSNPLLGFAVPLERLLHSPDDAVPAFETLLDSVDPWVRALARWQIGKLRTMLGQGGPEVEAELEQALAEFRALGERFGISVALSELAGLRAMRGDLAGACEYYEQAIAVVTEVGAVEDVIELRTQQAVLYWLDGHHDASAAAIAEAERSAQGVTWPSALADLALAKAELARLRGDAAEARRQLGLATTLLGDAADRSYNRAQIHDALGYLADDLREARTHRVAAWQAASEAGVPPPVIAQVLVGVADLAARRGEHEQAARLLAASVGARGMPNRSHHDLARIEHDVRRHLGDARFAEVTQEGMRTSWAQLVEVTLAS
ncbi:AfsR/SARP family transcriptional regulator [Jiangella ureilytica]|uniref:AfsR/SARP family transcriptional regulator n=1 Tax=Jiangella ureilytica TaxID=2530374 RepID=A0A4R4RN39_9ACTN|nr:BTAD domain-containing putative transcriptional regulator [Jiangella ureilytica]TDC51070.1 AfsR/SARP family transcriptional regulator [Jiangella ureilytica]